MEGVAGGLALEHPGPTSGNVRQEPTDCNQSTTRRAIGAHSRLQTFGSGSELVIRRRNTLELGLTHPIFTGFHRRRQAVAQVCNPWPERPGFLVDASRAVSARSANTLRTPAGFFFGFFGMAEGLVHDDTLRLCTSVDPDHRHRLEREIDEIVAAASRHQCRGIPGEFVAPTFNNAGRRALRDRDRFIKFVAVAWQPRPARKRHNHRRFPPRRTRCRTDPGTELEAQARNDPWGCYG